MTFLTIDHPSTENFTTQEIKEPGPINTLTDDCLLQIFSQLNLDLVSRASLCLVSHRWKLVASNPVLLKQVVYQTIAFRNADWAECEKDIVKDEDDQKEFLSLPNDIYEIIKRTCQALPGKGVKDKKIMLVRKPESIKTRKKLGELAKKYFPANPTGYQYIIAALLDEKEDKPIEGCYWALLTTELPESSKKFPDVQQGIVAKFAQKTQITYQGFQSFDGILCTLATIFRSGKCPFGARYIRALDKIGNYHIVIGGFKPAVVGSAPAGLYVYSRNYVSIHIGVAALRKF